MKLLEHQAKTVIAECGIPIPEGELAKNGAQARKIAAKLGLPITIKAQVPVAGRGKAGGILFSDSISGVEESAERLFSMSIQGMPVRSLLIEKKIEIQKELYFGIVIDRFNRCYVAVASAVGGMEIEEIVAEAPEKVIKKMINPQLGFRPFHAREIASKIGYSAKQLSVLSNIFEALYNAGVNYDAQLIEMNPLVETKDGNFVAADARMIMDDNSLFRHQEYKETLLQSQGQLSQQEREAAENGLAYVKLDGNIGVIGNGAGLVMATLDIIQYYGGRPANFLDLGGGATPESIAVALDIVLSDPSVETVFVNILGGITRCDHVAEGILEAEKKTEVAKPIIIRLVGTNEKEGRKLLTDAGMHVLESMEEAGQKIVQVSKQAGRR